MEENAPNSARWSMAEFQKSKVALLILRLSLGGFLLLWSLDKLLVPEATVGIFSHFYHLPLTGGGAYATGTLEAILSIAIMAGFRKTCTYGLGMALHAVSTLSSYGQLLHPFGKNHLFIAGIPVLGAFIALFLLRDDDTLWTLDG